MNIFSKRLVAYIIDMIFISFIVTLITSISFINFQFNNYQKYYKDYTKIIKERTDITKKIEKNETKYRDKKIKKKDYKSNLNKYNKKIKKIDRKNKVIWYKIQKNSVVYYIIFIAFNIAYFGIFQFSFNGQTFGKRIMKIRIISSKKKDLNIFQLILRSVIVYNLWIYLLYIIFVITVNNSNNYYNIYSVLNNIGSIIQIVTIMMVLLNKNGRGLHDIISSTEVCFVEKKVTDEPIEAEVIEES